MEFPAPARCARSLAGMLPDQAASNAHLAAPATEEPGNGIRGLAQNFAVPSQTIQTYVRALSVRHRVGNGIAGGRQSTDRKTSTDVLFLLGNCGTFMPLSRVRGESRIAVVWTWFVAAVSAISSGHFSVLFTNAVFLSVVACR